MQQILEQLLADKGSELVGLLTSRLGLDAEKARGFLPAAAQQILQAIGGGGIDLGALLGGGDLGALLSKIDIGSLARETGVDAETAAQGVKTVAPPLLEGLQQKAGGVEALSSLLGGGAGGGLLAKAGGLLGGFLKR